MKIYLPFDFSANISNLIRQAGYSQHNDFNTNQTSYTRRFSRDFYPRFHVYIEKDRDEKFFLNLHLDQKKPSYAGAHAHNADYDGGVVEKEGERLQGLINNQIHNQNQKPQEPSQEKESFWQKLFR